jgi:hypothetical protein
MRPPTRAILLRVLLRTVVIHPHSHSKVSKSPRLGSQLHFPGRQGASSAYKSGMAGVARAAMEGAASPHYLASHHRTTSQPMAKHAIVPLVPMAHAASTDIMSDTINLNSHEVCAIGNSSPGPTLGEQARSNSDHIKIQKEQAIERDHHRLGDKNVPGQSTFRGARDPSRDRARRRGRN